jgi:hypothetical protein
MKSGCESKLAYETVLIEDHSKKLVINGFYELLGQLGTLMNVSMKV